MQPIVFLNYLPHVLPCLYAYVHYVSICTFVLYVLVRLPAFAFYVPTCSSAFVFYVPKGYVLLPCTCLVRAYMPAYLCVLRCFLLTCLRVTGKLRTYVTSLLYILHAFVLVCLIFVSPKGKNCFNLMWKWQNVRP